MRVRYIVFFLLMALGVIARADRLGISPFGIAVGETEDVGVSLFNEKEYTAFQF